MNFLHIFVYLKNHDCGVLFTIIFKNLILYSRHKQKHKFRLNIFLPFFNQWQNEQNTLNISYTNIYVHMYTI